MKTKKRSSCIKVDEDLFLVLSWCHHYSPFSNKESVNVSLVAKMISCSMYKLAKLLHDNGCNREPAYFSLACSKDVTSTDW
jgi:hypothetical protein